MVTFFLKVIHQTCLGLLTEETDVFPSFSYGEDEIIMLEDLAVVRNLVYFSAWFFLTLVAVVLLNVLLASLFIFENDTQI